MVRLLRRHSSSRISAENTLVRDSRYVRQFPLSALLSAVARAQGEVVRVMLIVCGLPPLTDNLALAKSYSERMFQAEVLGALTPPEDMNAFVHPILESHRALDPGLGELVRADTEGFAFHIQFFGAVLWDALLPHEPITCKRFHQLRPEIVDALNHAFFDARLARTSRASKSCRTPKMRSAFSVRGWSLPSRSATSA